MRAGAAVQCKSPRPWVSQLKQAQRTVLIFGRVVHQHSLCMLDLEAQGVEPLVPGVGLRL